MTNSLPFSLSRKAHENNKSVGLIFQGRGEFNLSLTSDTFYKETVKIIKSFIKNYVKNYITYISFIETKSTKLFVIRIQIFTRKIFFW